MNEAELVLAYRSLVDSTIALSVSSWEGVTFSSRFISLRGGEWYGVLSTVFIGRCRLVVRVDLSVPHWPIAAFFHYVEKEPFRVSPASVPDWHLYPGLDRMMVLSARLKRVLSSLGKGISFGGV